MANNVDIQQDPINILGQLIKAQKTMLTPHQKGVNKALEETGYENTKDALKKVPPEQAMDLIKHITQSTGLSTVQEQINNPKQQNSGGLNENPQMTKSKGLFSSAQITPTGDIQESGAFGGIFGTNTASLLQNLLTASQIQQNKTSGKFDQENRDSLIENRNVETRLMKRQLEGGDTEKVYRDPVTGEEVDQATAEEDMKNGLGIYQVNQKISTRAGIVERKLNNVPDLTQEEKKYVNDARMIGSSLSTLESGYDNLYDKYGKANWQSFQIDKVPYILAQDQQVQDLKSELVYMKAAIPFLRGGKQLTPMEAKRIDVMLNPFGKNKETYKKDIQRFQDEFTAGADIMKFGVNAGLMKKLIKGGKKKSDSQNIPDSSSGWDDSKESRYQELLKKRGQ